MELFTMTPSLYAGMITVRKGASPSRADGNGRYLNHRKVLKVSSTSPMDAHRTLGRIMSRDQCRLMIEWITGWKILPVMLE
jgi:hypothetical protein